jgi:BASS family bile acid:Na+ symporter
MEPKELVILGLQVSIWATVFGFGLSARAGDVTYLFRHTNLLARSIVAMLVVMPVVAIILARVFRFEPGVEIAMVALALSPVPPLLPNKETKSGGSGAFAVGLLAILGLVSIFTVPASLEFLGRLAGSPLTISRAAIAGVILKGIVAPLVLGIAISALVPALADKLAGPVSKAAKLLLLLAVLPLLIATFPALLSLATSTTLLAILLFTAIGLFVGHRMGGPDPDQSVVLALSTASRHPMIAFSIASANFPDLQFGGIILLFLLVNALLCVPYLAWQRKHHAVGTIAVGPKHA